jgi:hypothetical protein
MRLINTRTLKLEQHYGDGIPAYAILSHTWGTKEGYEVTYQDWQDPSSASQKRGYNKIIRACQEARGDALDYLWIDTCCIDKTSSAELSEAINSMFAWYRDAKTCFAYLADVPSILHSSEHSQFKDQFLASRWFTRGWTLQELLAPKQVEFYSHSWSRLGDRNKLSNLISQATQIEETYLHGASLKSPAWLPGCLGCHGARQRGLRTSHTVC